MVAEDTVVMNPPDGYATVMGPGESFVGWVPNGMEGVVYLLTPAMHRALVRFGGKLLATVDQDVLTSERLEARCCLAPAG